MGRITGCRSPWDKKWTANSHHFLNARTTRPSRGILLLDPRRAYFWPTFTWKSPDLSLFQITTMIYITLTNIYLKVPRFVTFSDHYHDCTILTNIHLKVPRFVTFSDHYHDCTILTNIHLKVPRFVTFSDHYHDLYNFDQHLPESPQICHFFRSLPWSI